MDWDLGEITEEAIALWMEGKFERGENVPWLNMSMPVRAVKASVAYRTV